MQQQRGRNLQQLKVYPRWRPLVQSEYARGEIERSARKGSASRSRITISSATFSNRDKTWNSAASFTQVFETTASNEHIFKEVIEPTLPQVLNGATGNFFAYGHTGSGKTHTMIGENGDKLGLYAFAARWLCRELEKLNAKDIVQDSNTEGLRLGIGVRLYELRQKKVYDLLDGRKECYAREGYDGKTHIRGQTEMLEGEKVRVRPIVQKLCWNWDDVVHEVQEGLELRATGSSTVHDQSSRTHAVLEMEVVNKQLVDARDAVVEAESALVPVAKRATDVHVKEHSEALLLNEDGTWGYRPDRPLNQELIDATEAKKKEYESYVEAAEQKVAAIFSSLSESGLGGKLVFVDLAGAEYQTTGAASLRSAPKQTAQEKQEGRQINTDLLALKEVIRAWALSQSRIPFRSSTLTMVLREHFLASASSFSGMIVTVSPSTTQLPATMNSLKYADLVGEAK